MLLGRNVWYLPQEFHVRVVKPCTAGAVIPTESNWKSKGGLGGFYGCAAKAFQRSSDRRKLPG